MPDNKDMWQAVLLNDSRYDGQFWYAVKSTGIFCRPSCKSKPPLESNVAYFDTPQAAMDAGYRPCKRCRPDLMDHPRIKDMAEQMKVTIEGYYNNKFLLFEELSKISISRNRMVQIFKEQYGSTPGKYADMLRIQTAKDKLSRSKESIIEIALFLGFESLSAFYGFFRKYTQMAPGEYRRSQMSVRHGSPSFWHSYETSLGRLIIEADNSTAITSGRFEGTAPPRGEEARSRLTDLAVKQLEEYAEGKRKKFELPLSPVGTAFQKSVWRALDTIPYGETRSYIQIARQVGKPAASRAVGMANNKNPLPIIIPCHRVIGSNGALTGYAGGLLLKKRLLVLEAKYRGKG